MGENDVSLSLEQEGCNMRLPDWLIAGFTMRFDILHANPMVRALGKIWLRHKNHLVPPYSLLQKYTQSSDCKQLDFIHWNKAGFTRFKDILIKGQLIRPSYFQTKTDKLNILQYYQF